MSDLRETVSIAERKDLLAQALRVTDLCRIRLHNLSALTIAITTKPDRSLVTTVDREVENLFRYEIAAAFPSHGVIGEEFGATNPQADFQWIIDPIDGTEDFVARVPLYGTIIALHYRHHPLIGIIDQTALGIRIHAAYGFGTFLDQTKITLEDFPKNHVFDGRERVAIGSRQNFLRGFDDGSVFDLLCQKHPNVRVYHTCFAHLYAATGGVDAAVDWNVHLWDLAATRLLVEEAGGVYHLLKERKDSYGELVYCAVFGKPKLVSQIVAELGK